ncbi:MULTISPECIES: hypothetical protein [unclassified Mesorhizobium]|uniref:hypothetical protein n=1 Tax=unclassified Mesorhizobium TaxID=325217 RepID=UPI0011285841|nr:MULTISPECIES: hypothetical protein [unclassified Mesorhizobium]TPI57644.1 hypothetical protein FJ417_21285 [Mesorhizobium sp. B3-1-7]TPJ37014.1 hypothetical protein FJ418_01720 [Mesorhizobium sp. B2-8-3]
MISAPNGSGFCDITAVARELSLSDLAVPIEDIVRSLYENLHEGEPCPPALIEAFKQALQNPAREETDANGI